MRRMSKVVEIRGRQMKGGESVYYTTFHCIISLIDSVW